MLDGLAHLMQHVWAKGEQQMNTKQHTHEALDASKWPHVWRPCVIESATPKTLNYPGGGFYVRWADISVCDRRQSTGGWIPGHMLRRIQ